MRPTERNLEAQIYKEADGPKHFFSVRNIAIVGVVLLLVVAGLGYFYRKELFGMGGTEVVTGTAGSKSTASTDTATTVETTITPEIQANLDKLAEIEKLLEASKYQGELVLPYKDRDGKPSKGYYLNPRSLIEQTRESIKQGGSEVDFDAFKVEMATKIFADVLAKHTFKTNAEGKYVLPLITKDGSKVQEDLSSEAELKEKIKEYLAKPEGGKFIDREEFEKMFPKRSWW